MDGQEWIALGIAAMALFYVIRSFRKSLGGDCCSHGACGTKDRGEARAPQRRPVVHPLVTLDQVGRPHDQEQD